MNNAFNRSGLAELRIESDVEALSEAEAAPWRRALAAVRKHLWPSPDFMFYMQTQLCEDFARNGDLEESLFVTSVESDMYALHLICCRHGGPQTFQSWAITSLPAFVNQFCSLRLDVRFAFREMIMRCQQFEMDGF